MEITIRVSDGSGQSVDRVPGVSEPNLSESAWQRATESAALIYRSTGFGVAATLMTIIFGSVAAVASAGETTTAQIAVPILGGALALCLTFGVLFAIQLAAAPVRQRNELRAAWEAPEIETVNVGLTLRNLYRKGDELRQRFGTAIGRRGEQEAEHWADSVAAFLSKQTPEDSAREFLEAGQSERAALRRFDTRLQTLQKIIESVG